MAPFYPILEGWVFGSRLDNARNAFYDAVLQANRVLLVGEGNGRFLKSLLAQKMGGCIKVVEKTPMMVRLAKDRIRSLPEIRCDLEFIQTDFRNYRPEQQFDCVVTHFFLDQFNPPAQETVIERIAELSIADAIWINVDFTSPKTLGGRVLMWSQYVFFRVLSRIEATRGFDETAAAGKTGWIVADTLSFLGGLVVAKQYRKRKTARQLGW